MRTDTESDLHILQPSEAIVVGIDYQDWGQHRPFLEVADREAHKLQAKTGGIRLPTFLKSPSISLYAV